MSHQVNKCACGRTRHWPQGAKAGDTWKCRACGAVTTLVPAGTPGADSHGVIVPSWGPRHSPRPAPPASLRPHRLSPGRVPPTPRPQGLFAQILNLLSSDG